LQPNSPSEYCRILYHCDSAVRRSTWSTFLSNKLLENFEMIQK
jgi:hypothetical protein